MDVRALLEQLEREEDPTAALAYLAGSDLDLDARELQGALRRALLLLAAGGDPRRELDPNGRAVRAVAADLGSPARADALTSALDGLRADAAGFPRVLTALDALVAEPGLAWRWFACALVAEQLGGSDD